MRKLLRRLVPQPLTAFIMCLLALAALVGAGLSAPRPVFDVASLQTLLIAAALAAAVVVAGLYPIHIQYRTKVLLTTPPLYLAAVLLTPLAAALTAGLGVLVYQLMARKKKGSLPSDIATAVSRWVLVAYLGSLVAHLGDGSGLQLLLSLAGAAGVLFVGDVVTTAFEIAPMSGEPPLHVMLAAFQGAGLIEVAQYLLGMLGALAARQAIWALALMVVPTYIIYAAFKHTKEMYNGTRQLLESMADAVDLRDAYTGGHSRRVADYSLGILRALDVNGPEADLIYVAARVHDIGKIGVPDAILNKPERLTPEERRIMDSHPERGAELIARYSDFARGVEIIRHHHERWDGQGYPAGLKGLEIPFGARVIAVVDSFDAMTSDRPYRAAMSVTQASRILAEGRGIQWDATLVDAFLRHLAGQQPAARPQPAGAAQVPQSAAPVSSLSA